MYQVTIPHNQQGQAAIKFDTEDRNIAWYAYKVGEAIGVEVKVVQTVEPCPVKFRNA